MTDIVRAHVIRDREVLLGLRLPPNERWSTFGGWAEEGESPEDTLRRELREELGIEIEEYQRLADREATWDGKAQRIAVFAVTKWRGTPENAAPDEHSEIGWYRREELAELSMHEAARAEALSLLEASAGSSGSA